ncbi:MAG: hypothetical protein EHM25_01040 [Nitrosopumilales archaeon]|nr:MAG: hypothetical protein EHM25_12680 [Nitrosopumilales archaeon]RPJ31553.1 MAG: hypothetical protein EHM25_02650 [Nitrosopumilales archaeon]RPJ32336.1 MAG: hypothetical protein EHM25_01040 [Nitrosopumilales archaeon]
MEDKFKFRVWSLFYEKMYDFDFLSLSASGFGLRKYMDYRGISSIMIMQCTGLTDVNDKLIYEGDILDVFDRSTYQETGYFEVIWDSDRYYLKSTKGKWEDFSYHVGNDHFEVEIIGNIYENPELIINNEL